MNNKLILIVEDEEDILELLEYTLQKEGYETIGFLKIDKNVRNILNEEQIDLILLDIMMPDMNGFEVCTKLKNEEKTKNIPIIFLSGKDSSQDVEQAYECGGIDYVVKPFVTIELITKANSYVRLKQLEDKFELLKDTQNV